MNLPASISDTTPRYDIYAGIHKALRAYMSDTLCKLGAADWTDAEDTEAALAQLRNLLALCVVHLDDENRFVHPALEAARSGMSHRIAGEHVHHQTEIAALQAAADLVEGAGMSARSAAGLQLYHRCSRFIAENFEHMLFEETVHNAVLWAEYGDAELLAIEQAIVAAVPPEMMGLILPWFMSALNHHERVGMLGGMRQGMPAEVFAGVLAMTRTRLSQRDWRKLQQALALPLDRAA